MCAAVPTDRQSGPGGRRAPAGTAGLTALDARQGGEGHAASRPPVIASSAIAPYTRLIVDRPRLNLLSRGIL